jgi:hypothetical protein
MRAVMTEPSPIRRCVAALVLGHALLCAGAGAAPAPPKRLETVVVSGVQPGPGLWRVSRDGHELWILGTLSPLPKRMEWESRDVEATIARSQAVLLPPGGRLEVEGGALRGLFLLPSVLGARDNPDDASLADVVPADLYARWTVLKARYLGRDRAIEKRRPIFAASKLYGKALSKAGLSLDDRIVPVVRKAAKRHDVPIVRSEIEIVLEEPKAAVKEFKRTKLDDVECFRLTLERVETDLGTMQERANAWATGDVAWLREQRWSDQGRACADAFLHAGALEKRGLRGVEERLAAAWLASAERALGEHRTSFAVLPIRLILDSKGYVARLAERGYTVEAPDGDAGGAR